MEKLKEINQKVEEEKSRRDMLDRNFNNQESKSSKPTRGKSNLKFKEQPETLMPEEKKRSKSAIRP